MKYLFAILGLVGYCCAQHYQTCDQWRFTSCTKNITMNLNTLYHYSDKCSKAKEQSDKLSDCRHKYMDSCSKSYYSGWGTTDSYMGMENQYNEVLGKIQNAETNHCMDKKPDNGNNHWYEPTAEPSSSCQPYYYKECVNRIHKEAEYKPRGPNHETCMEMQRLTGEWNNCQMNHFSNCMNFEHSHNEAEKRASEVLNDLSDRERESCKSDHHYYMGTAAGTVSKYGGALVAVSCSLVLLLGTREN